MMKTTILFLSLFLASSACKSENRPATDDSASTKTETVQAQPTDQPLDVVELPIFGNFQLDTFDNGDLKLLFFSPENEMSISRLHWDDQEAMHTSTDIYTGTYHTVGQPNGNVYTVVFELTAKGSTEKLTGRLLVDFHEGNDNELHSLWITPVQGFDLGLPANQVTQVPISAFQAWD